MENLERLGVGKISHSEATSSNGGGLIVFAL